MELKGPLLFGLGFFLFWMLVVLVRGFWEATAIAWTKLDSRIIFPPRNISTWEDRYLTEPWSGKSSRRTFLPLNHRQ